MIRESVAIMNVVGQARRLGWCRGPPIPGYFCVSRFLWHPDDYRFWTGGIQPFLCPGGKDSI